MAVKSPPPTFPATLTTSFGPAVARGPPAEGALTPTSPEPGTAAAGKPVQGGQQLSSPHKSLSVSRHPLPVLSPQSASVFSFAPSPLTIAHPPPEFLWTGIWTAPPLALLPPGPPVGRRKTVKLLAAASISSPHCASTNLDPYREALAERFPLRLAVRRDVRHGRGGGGDGYGAVGDVLAGRPVHLSVGRLDGRREGFHAVDAFGGIGQARLGADARPRAGAPVHVGILRRFGAALGRDGDERFRRRGPRRDRGRRLLVGGDA